ncbi:MAG: Crp/Fnr family transcriptional regulator [Myxococcales bacterium]|nr:Crp/Fnr family transcriptional regulator [Myxococcales bacterium]
MTSRGKPNGEGCPDCARDCIGKHNLIWANLSPGEQHLFNEIRIPMSFKRRQIVIHQGGFSSGVHCVLSGVLAQRLTDPQGNTVLTRVRTRSALIGLDSVVLDEAHHVSTEALTDTSTCFIPKDALMWFYQANERFARSLTQELAREVRHFETQRLIASFQIRTRVLQFLYDVADEFGDYNDEGQLVISLPLSRQDIASYMGVRHESITRTIRDLARDGIAIFHKREVTIDDIDRLLDEIEGEPF